MAKKEIKKKTLNFLDFLKDLTNYLNSNNYNIETILRSIDKHKVNNQFLFKRLFAYNYNNPYIIWYINKYMNDKYKFFYYDTKNYLTSFKYIMNSNNQKKLFFFKAKDFKDENKYKVKSLLKEYYSYVHKKYLNDMELNQLYLLFCKQIITVDELKKIDKLLNGEKSNLDLDIDFLNKVSSDTNIIDNKEKLDEYIQYSLTRQLPTEIFEFIKSLKEKKENRSECSNCKLKNNEMLVLDTNKDSFGEVDFMFINLNPDKESAAYNKVCCDESGKILRQNLFYFDKKITWCMINIIQCTTKTDSEIGKTPKQIKTVAQNCQDFLTQIFQKFTAKFYIPIGKHAMEYFGIKGSIVQNCGQIIKVNNNQITMIPLINPSSIRMNESINKPVYDNAWNILYQIGNKLSQKTITTTLNQNIQQLPTTDIQQISQNQNIQQGTNSLIKPGEFNLPSEKIISIVTDNLTYFDSVNLDGNRILNIYIDENGEKFYNLEKFEIPIYIKNVSYDQCSMLNDNFDYVTYINGWNRYKLSKGLKDNLLKHRYSAEQNN
jgi:uracil-DNA glycosylase